MSRLYEKFLECDYQVITDSRAAKNGEMYFALRGENFDGNNFAISALASGAKYAVVDNPEIKGENIILVEDVLTSLQDLACEHRQKLGIQIFALTGTNGKTTTKELIRSALECKYTNVGCTKGNLNNHIGVPLTLLSFSKDTEIGVVEMGANHPGEIAALCKIAMPNVGLITNIGMAHLEGFGSFDGVRNTKAELYNYLNKNNGTVIYNADDEVITALTSRLSIEAKRYNSTEFQAVELQLFGGYNKINAAAALAVAEYFGVDRLDAINAIKSYKPTNNRSEIVNATSHSNKLVVDCYNANPSSMQAAVNEFIRCEGKDGVLILGAMRELGEYSESEHKKLYELCCKYGNKCYFIGKEFNGIAPTECYFESAQEAINQLNITNKSVLIKGSRSVGLEKLLTIL